MTYLVLLSGKGYSVNITRLPGNKHFGNPFSHIERSYAPVKVATREEAVARHMSWLKGETDHDVEPERRKWILANLHRLKDKRLGCLCGPLPCHGMNYLELLDS